MGNPYSEKNLADTTKGTAFLRKDQVSLERSEPSEVAIGIALLARAFWRFMTTPTPIKALRPEDV